MKVLVISEQAQVRRQVAGLLQEANRFVLAGEASHEAPGLALAAAVRPDVVLLEPGPGLGTFRLLTAVCPTTTPVLLTRDSTRAAARAGLAAGAASCIPLDRLDALLVPSLECLRGGLAVLPVAALPLPLAHPTSTEEAHLTGAEWATLRLLVRGYDTAGIAEELAVAYSTVKKYIRHLLNKLQAADRVSLVLKALRLGWVDLDGTLPR